MSLPQADIRLNFNKEDFQSYLSVEALEQNNESLYEAVFRYAKTLNVFDEATDIL